MGHPGGCTLGDVFRRHGNHTPDGNVRLRLTTLVVAKCCFECGQRHLIYADGTHKWMFGEARNNLRFANQDSCVRPTKDLITRETHAVTASRNTLPWCWLMR